MSAHTLWELQQKKSLPLDAKILMTKRRLKQWHIQYNGNVYLAFSGGKDSTVLKDILQDIFPDVPAVFCNTGLEYPEVKKFAMSQNNVKVITPKMMFKEVISRYGYPVISKEQSSYIADIRNTKSEYIRNLRLNGNKTKSYKLSEKWKFMLNAPFKISDKCCKIMKKEPFIRYERETGSKGIIATMTDESSLRLNTWLRFGCNAFNAKRPLSRPMSFWTEQDVLQYIVEHNLKEEQINRIKTTSYHQNQRRIQSKECRTTLCSRDWKDPKCVRVKQLFNLVDHKTGFSNPQTGRVYATDGLSPCLSAMQGGGHEPKIKCTDDEFKIRKLTPLECWRLMDFDDNDFYKARNAGISNSQLYKQAGNSIVVNVLQAIFRQFNFEKVA